jgi:hypothetical protein
MDTARTDITKVGLPAGLTVTQLVWLDARTLEIRYTGSLPSFGAKRVDLFDGYFLTPGLISIPFGSGLAFNYPDPAMLAVGPHNHPPIIALGPLAKTEKGVTSFSSIAVDPDKDPLAYTWEFGDGATAAGQDTTHTYVGEGSFIARLTVIDGRGGSVTATVLVGAAARIPWTVTKAQISLGFAKAGRDKITVSGVMDLEAGFDPDKKTMIVDVGGVRQTFTLDAKGKAKAGKDTFKLTRKLKKKVFLGGAVKVQFRLSGSFTDLLKDEGFISVDTPRAGTQVPVTMLLILDGTTYEAKPNSLYKAKANKTGKGLIKTAIRR